MKDEESVFAEVLRCDSPAERAAALESARTDDAGLRRRVEALVAAHEKAQGILDVTPPGIADSDADVSSAAEPVGTSVGPYKLLERIGEGGMGAVYMAEQQRPVRRMVALKIIKPGMDSRQVVARFEAERQALAMMDDPGIARVFDAGTTEAGRPYFAMELVKGVPITDYCDVNNLTGGERLPLFVQVCHAVQHAHTKGVIHRDLKPTNILVTLHDGVPVPKIIDFGIAKATGGASGRLTDKTLFTHFAQMIGTPLYMSPEQAEFSGLDVDTRSDVYSLGVLLYELLTGTTPFDRQRLGKAALDEVRRIIREEEPPRPSTRLSTLAGVVLTAVSANRRTDAAKLGRSVRGELDWIVMKALEKDRTRRYETASGMADDVRRYLADEPVLACPPTALYRFRKFARRNKRALATAAVLALAAVVGVTALAVSTAAVSRANKGLSESVDRERRAAGRERSEAYFQRITVAHRELTIDNLAAALRALGECPEELRGWEWYYLARLCKVDPLVVRDDTAVNGLAFSRNGDRLAAACGDGTIKIRDGRTGEVVRVLQSAAADSVLSVAFHRDGRHVASRDDKKVTVWEWETGREVFVRLCDANRDFGSACTVAFSPDGRQLAAGSDGTVSVWDWEADEPLHSFVGHQRIAISVAYSPDGRWLASACTGEGLKLWDPLGGGPVRAILGQHHPLSALAFSPDGAWLASASLDHRLKLWDPATGELLRIMVHGGNVESVAFSPDARGDPRRLARRIATVGEEKTVRLWDPDIAPGGREVLGLRGHTARCGSVAFSPDGWRIASAGTDKTIRFWDATPLRPDERQELFTFAGHDDEIRSVVVSPDGKVASAGQGALVKFIDAATGAPAGELDVQANPVFGLAWHPDGERFAAAGWDGRQHAVHLRDVRKQSKAFTIAPGPQDPTAAFFAVAISPDGRHLVTGEASGAVHVWDARTGAPVGLLGRHKREVRGVVFSPDGKHLATASSDGDVNLWDATRLDQEHLDAKPAPRLPPLGARVPGPSVNLAFSPDGRRIATGGDNYTVKVWEVETGGLLLTIPGHRGDVYAVAFSPDDEGRWIASGGEDSTVKLWDSRSGAMVRSFRGHTGLVSTLAFSRDGRRLYSGSRDHTVKGWDLTPFHTAAPATRPIR